MAIYRTSIFKSSLIPGLITALLIAPLGNVLAQQAENSASEQDAFVGDNKSTYGPIKASDTLWKIANAYRPDDSVTNYQVMVALFKTNPNAFVNNDINFLIQGQYLRIPDLAQISQVVPFHQQNDSDASLNKINSAIASTRNSSIATGETADTRSTPVTNKVEASDQANAAVVIAESRNSEPATEQAPKSVAQENGVASTVESAVASNSEPVEDADTRKFIDVAAEQQPQSGLVLEGVAEYAGEKAAETPADPAQVSNREVEESLAAVGVKLDDLQYELERSKQNQAQLDQKLDEQSALLLQAKKREQRLMAEQEALKKRNDGLFNSPTAYWSVIAVLFVLVAVLTVMVQRRRRVEKELLALKPGLSANKKAQNVKPQQTSSVPKSAAKNNPGQGQKSAPVAQVAESTKTIKTKATKTTAQKINDASVMQPSAALFGGGVNQDKNSGNSPATQNVSPAAKETQHDPIAQAFAKVELKATHVEADDLVSEADLLANLVKNEANETLDNDLDMDHIIEDMVDEDSKAKPAKLHSDSFTNNDLDLSSSQLKEIDDFDDVEFDKLLEEISSDSEHISYEPQTTASSAQVDDRIMSQSESAVDQDFVEIEDIIADSEASVDESEPYQEGKIDVGLDEFPEFTQNVNSVNVDDDKHGVNAKLDLAQVYIEIGDEDNAAVILKNVMKLGNSSQQQQAQQLLYSLKP